jgi:hypothetical protein
MEDPGGIDSTPIGDAAARASPDTQKPQARMADAAQSSCLKLKGLPYNTSEQQIYEFFEGFKVGKVAFVYEPDGRPSGLVSDDGAGRRQRPAAAAIVQSARRRPAWRPGRRPQPPPTNRFARMLGAGFCRV